MKLTIHYPNSEAKCLELARRVAVVHADTALQYIEHLSCSKAQKATLMDAVISMKRKERSGL